MPAASASVKALEKGANSTLLITVVSAILALGGWFLAVAGASMGQIPGPDGQLEPYLSSGAITLLSAIAGFCLVLCAAMWAAHLVLSSLADAETARETAASEAAAAARAREVDA